MDEKKVQRALELIAMLLGVILLFGGMFYLKYLQDGNLIQSSSMLGGMVFGAGSGLLIGGIIYQTKR